MYDDISSFKPQFACVPPHSPPLLPSFLRGVSDIAYLERVLVDQVQGVARELGTTTGVTANQIRVLVTCNSDHVRI